jgi:hypothetical protein
VQACPPSAAYRLRKFVRKYWKRIHDDAIVEQVFIHETPPRDQSFAIVGLLEMPRNDPEIESTVPSQNVAVAVGQDEAA